ncbi:hypothetical protein [Janthinobacterium sp. 1_2014MBL_MicDiv]|uniref:hypothetical protein n=1 Tax=Janthinobacterium sp. 1_2014MBL_MicDiv TaxID=1644131 RepID=UPI0012EC0E8E|nr:hypothetical protein [Janthinobacterium sp. 1_2014MBL_MicDiv]
MSEYKTSWTELNFIEKETISAMSPDVLSKNIKWVEFPAEPGLEWLCETNNVIMDFGGTFHSIYLRWAVTINGLHVAVEKYRNPSWIKRAQVFKVAGFRNAIDGSGPRQTPVRVWTPDAVAKVHESSIPMLAAWAFCNMYSCLEEFVFKIFRIYLDAHPLVICKGDEFKALRRAYNDRVDSQESLENWKTLWNERLESWHRKRLYDGLEKVFLNYCNVAGLEIPVAYKGEYGYEAVAKTLGGISLIRNCFIHGATVVPVELAEFCKGFESLFFSYEEGRKFEISLNELATLEYFTDTLTQTLNSSILELSFPEIKDLNKRFAKESKI